MRYHVCLGFPKTIVFPTEVNLIYSRHAIMRKQENKVKLKSKKLKIELSEIIEVRTEDNKKARSILVRKKLNDKKDVLLSLRLGKKHATVITLWVNNVGDHHATLNESKYDLPDNYNSREIDFIYAGI